MTQWQVNVIVMPKDGVSDPPGEAVKGGLISLGHDGVTRVRVGRHIEVTVDADSEEAAHAQVEQMAGQLLANPVIEQFTLASARPSATVGQH